MNVLAYTPLLDPLTAVLPGMDDYWLWLVIPLVVAITVVYKGTREKDLRKLPAGVLVMSIQILMVMVGSAVLLAGGYWVAVRMM